MMKQLVKHNYEIDHEKYDNIFFCNLFKNDTNDTKYYRRLLKTHKADYIKNLEEFLHLVLYGNYEDRRNNLK